MVLKVVTALPVGRESGEPLYAFAAASLRLHHMSNGVRGPEIGGVELHGAAPGRLGGEIVPGLLLGEAAAGEYRCIAWDVLRPTRRTWPIYRHVRKAGIASRASVTNVLPRRRGTDRCAVNQINRSMGY
jgi:hypothetical protein